MRPLIVALYLVLSGCALPPQPQSTYAPAPVGSPGQGIAQQCGPPPQIPRSLYSDPNFKFAFLTVRFEVLPTKESRDVKISKSSGYEALDEAAILAVQQWRCTLPGAATTPLVVEVPFVFSAYGEPLPPTTATVLWAGTYGVDSRREVDDPTEPSGKRGVVEGVRAERKTDKILAEVGTSFGVAFVFTGADPSEVLRPRIVWKFPPQGIANPETGKRTFTVEREARCQMNRQCFTGRRLVASWELVEGPWEVQIWLDKSLVLQKTFVVSKR